MISTDFFSKEWVLENLITEILFGVILFGFFIFIWRHIMDIYRAIKVYKIISTHNNPTRTRRKGIYALDRFMNIYESKRSVVSNNTPLYGLGEVGGIWSEQVVDKDILEYHKLVIVKENEIGQEITVEVEACINRFTRIVYIIAKWFEERERKKTERIIIDESGKFKKSNYKLQKRILV